jgi:ABC-type transport system involved in multi-copper enzyme maturation permease subunit
MSRPPDTEDHDRLAPVPALASIVAVARFQLARLLTPARLALAALGVLFPVAVLAAAVKASGSRLNTEVGAGMLYALVPEAVCMLGLLVTMSPVVADELERGTWVHVAVRPGGRRSLLLGTWLASVVWTATVALLALGLALASDVVAKGSAMAGTFTALVLLSCVGRAALFALPAVIVPKKALVASVGVAILVEYLAGLIPAVINQFTVSLRLRTLLVAWMGWQRQMPAEFSLLIDPHRPWWQVAAVLGMTVAFLAVACAILEWRQFPPSEES